MVPPPRGGAPVSRCSVRPVRGTRHGPDFGVAAAYHSDARPPRSTDGVPPPRTARSHPAGTRSGPAVDSAAIAAAGAAFSRAYVAGDTATIRDLHTSDALLLPPGGRVEGIDRVVRFFGPGPRRENLSHSMTSERLEISGDVAVDVGTWSNRWRIDAGPVQEASDRYLIVWKRGEDGRWRIAYDMWHRPSA